MPVSRDGVNVKQVTVCQCPVIRLCRLTDDFVLHQ